MTPPPTARRDVTGCPLADYCTEIQLKKSLSFNKYMSYLKQRRYNPMHVSTTARAIFFFHLNLYQL